MYRKALDYAKSSPIEFWDISDDYVRGVVKGTIPYLATLTAMERPDGGFAFNGLCTCPASDEKYLCKHALALGLKASEGEADRTDGHVVDDFLQSRSHEELIAIIRKQAVETRGVFENLKIEAITAYNGRYPDAHGFLNIIRLLLEKTENDLLDPDAHLEKIENVLLQQLKAGDPELASHAALMAAVHYNLYPISREEDFSPREYFNDPDDEDFEYEDDLAASTIDDALSFFEIHAQGLAKAGVESGRVLEVLKPHLDCFSIYPERIAVYRTCFGEQFAKKLQRISDLSERYKAC